MCTTLRIHNDIIVYLIMFYLPVNMYGVNVSISRLSYRPLRSLRVLAYITFSYSTMFPLHYTNALHTIAKSNWIPPGYNEDINRKLKPSTNCKSITNKHRDSVGNL